MTAELETDATKLNKKIVRQVEFYFGDYNLHRDKFMKEEMAKSNGWFSMDTMLKFKRLSTICSEPGTILAALNKSKNNLLEVDIEKQCIRRKPSRPVPENNESYRHDLKMRTVYIKGFSQTETIEDITEFLEEYGVIEGVHLRKFNNPHTGSIFKGSLFATFQKLEDAQKFLEAPMLYYKKKPLEKKSKDAFWKEKEQESSQRKSSRKQSRSSEPKKVDENPEDNYSFVQVLNLDDETISHLDMKSFLTDLGAAECKFFSRYVKNGPSGYILFSEKDSANEMLALLKDKSEDCCALIKASTVKFEAMSPEQRKEALECYHDFRGFNRPKKGKKRGGHFDGRKKDGKPSDHIVFDDNGDATPAKQAKSS